MISDHRSGSTAADNGSGPAYSARDICVAICTHDRPALLRRALHSLQTQTCPPAEILIVDNAPPDSSTQTMVSEEFPSIRYVLEETIGLDFARNRAISETRKEIVAFIDDDAVADADWVAATIAAFNEFDHLTICTGKVDALMLETDGQRLFEANGGFAKGDRRIHLPQDRSRAVFGIQAPLISWCNGVGCGCSFAVRRDRIVDLGGFDEALDMGADLPGGGDHDMIWRVLAAGDEVLYEPSVKARHEHRRELKAAINQILGHNRSLIAVLTKSLWHARGGNRIGVFAFLIWRLGKPGIRIVRGLVGRDPLPVKVLVLLWIHSFRGLGTYPAARRLARSRAAQSRMRNAVPDYSDARD